MVPMAGPQHIGKQHGFPAHAPGQGTGHIVLFQLFQHGGPNLPGVPGRHGQSQRHRRQHQTAAAAQIDDRQPPELDGEDQQQQQSREKVGQRISHKADGPDHVVNHRPWNTAETMPRGTEIRMVSPREPPSAAGWPEPWTAGWAAPAHRRRRRCPDRRGAGPTTQRPYWTKKGWSSPSSARLASRTAWETLVPKFS